jgi:uncharacterized protein YndB with AHSA1/START domain
VDVIEVAIEIAQPIEDVFALVGDPGNDSQWQTDVKAVERMDEGPLAEGAAFRWVVDFLGKRAATLRLIRSEPPHLVELQAITGRMGATFTYLLDAAPEGTRVTVRTEVHPCAMSNLMAPVMERLVRRRSIGHLENLKNVLEGRPAQLTELEIDPTLDLFDGFA